MVINFLDIEENRIAREAVDAALQVHRILGPGLLESVYEKAMAVEFGQRGIDVIRQHPIVVEYRGVALGEGYRADMLVGGKILLELKSLESIQTIHQKQLLTYLRLSGYKLGLLLNFGNELMRDDITRIVNGLPDSPRHTK